MTATEPRSTGVEVDKTHAEHLAAAEAEARRLHDQDIQTAILKQATTESETAA